MGIGFCCCGDSDPPGPSSGSNSRSSAPLTVDCFRCSSGCRTPGIKMPSFLYLDVELIDNGDVFSNPATGTKNTNCNCEIQFGRAVAMFRDNASCILYSKSNSSCEWYSDCFAKKNYSIQNTTDRCFGDPSNPFTTFCKQTPLTPTGLSAENWVWYNFGWGGGTGCSSLPTLSWESALSDSSGGLGPCPALSSRSLNNNVTHRYNEVFSCDPFYYEAELYYIAFGHCGISSIINPIGCCINDCGTRYIGLRVTVSGS